MSVDVVSFGCRLNGAESDVIRRQAQAVGLVDTIVVNTCAVTAEAVRQARQAIRKAARERPGAKILVTGCAAAVEPQSFANMPEVASVVANDRKISPEFWREYRDRQPSNAANLLAGGPGRPAGAAAPPARPREVVAVQNGCDHRCTFCIIPYGRGPSRSAPMGEVVAAVRGCVARGAGEVVLAGVDLTSYGDGLPGAPRLGTLVRQVLKHVPELPRLRLSSIDQVEADRGLLDAFASEPRLMPHLHLSLQAGDDLVLKRMKRRHLRGDAIQFCEQVRRLRPDVAFGADIIAGFPTETEAMFARSLDLVDECGLTHLHVFPFSARPGTPAARMPQVAPDVVKERARRLRRKAEAALRGHLDAQVGATRRVMIESPRLARTEQFTQVRLAGPPAPPGAIVDVAIAGHDGRQLMVG